MGSDLQLELAFSVSQLAQAENLKVLIANTQFQKLGISENVDESHSTISLKDSKSEIDLIEANAAVLYLASKFTQKNAFATITPEQTAILTKLRGYLLEYSQDESKFDRATFAIEGLPAFKDNEPIYNDPFQILIFGSLYPFHVAKFRFVNQYKWFSKFFKNPQINGLVKQVKAHTFAVTTAINKKNNQGKTASKPKKDSGNTRVINATKTGEQKLTANAKEHLKVAPEDVILPKSDKQNILITSALPYVNNVPHLGNIIGSVLSADVFARYVKAKKQYNVLFVGGTDEYGTATETKALEDKTTPQALCDKYHKVHNEIYKWFDIDFDFFGRTTTELQTEISQDIFMKLWKNGYLSEQTIQQLYCEHHKGFLADRYVNGTCPKCEYPKARGDQCDGCGSLLNPLELIDPKCKLDGHVPVAKYSDHIYLNLDQLEPETKAWIEKQSVEGDWTKNTNNITNNWLKEGLRPFSITRDLKWGTPVPLEKYGDKVLYVWFDATIGYVSITANYFKNKGVTDDWKKWWKTKENDVRLYQFMGKDNVSFHSIIFPASLIGTGDDWTKNYHIDTTEYLQYEGGKFSKSEKIGVFGDQAKETGISASVWRYYLINVRPETSDSQFSWDDFVRCNNTELLNNLGNFSNRLIKFVNKNYKGVVPTINRSKFSLIKDYDSLIDNLNTLLKKYNDASIKCEERRALEYAMAISARGNQFLQENKLDNSLFNGEPDKSDLVVYIGLNILVTVSQVISPFMPATSENINKQLNIKELYIPDEFVFSIDEGHNIGEADYLFSKIDDKMVESWRKKYGGKQE
ncbi:methionine--tRNA ligase [Saccharomycopsis crataegensis]|uniref:methionine--tRNA ligase n=1 Tax=Saccharomycopsis crataegensis TaxID=43959 RepID=A0AAV5QEU7_9ASCO|nr:methionine--tRNA ligase [Saccharomycopsis crataegensis]